MGMMYVPAELVSEVELLKEFRRKEKCYDIICYDSKEETENEERTFPHTPFKKEEKEKEEGATGYEQKKKSLKKDFFVKPTMDEIEAYRQQIGATDFSASDFFDYYESYGWMTRCGGRVRNWKSLMRGWKRKDDKRLFKQLKDNEQIKKTTHTGAHTGQDRDARAREMGEWLDEHYPVSHKAAATNHGSAAAADEPLGSDLGCQVCFVRYAKIQWPLTSFCPFWHKGLSTGSPSSILLRH